MLLPMSPRPVYGSRLLGFGAARPAAVVTADQLGAPFGKDGAWVQARTGIRSSCRVADAAELRRLATEAADQVLAQTGTAARDVDLVITASCSSANGPDDTGSLAADVAGAAAHLHLNAACSGFCYALSTADNFIRAGDAERVLVVAAEHMTSLVEPGDLGTSIIFGDGAGAALVARTTDGTSGIGPAVWGSDGSQSKLIDCGAIVGGRLRMAGQQVFRWAVDKVPAIAREACARAGVRLGDIDVFVPHQANGRIIDAVAARLGMSHAIVADDVATAGNTSAASIPLALADLTRRRAVEAGQLALLVGFGAGLSYAAQVIQLP
ncbi:beta-ketoacyl-ACP synthase 3 [uncultured Jatrophihabitans sp.]|uniref:beta-ketoacyl-ACP synthase 3 n=1 Tax=uncultured Jatrophihabitans sp. TaxID=1610747 RepID=UPI0035C947E8